MSAISSDEKKTHLMRSIIHFFQNSEPLKEIMDAKMKAASTHSTMNFVMCRFIACATQMMTNVCRTMSRTRLYFGVHWSVEYHRAILHDIHFIWNSGNHEPFSLIFSIATNLQQRNKICQQIILVESFESRSGQSPPGYGLGFLSIFCFGNTYIETKR